MYAFWFCVEKNFASENDGGALAQPSPSFFMAMLKIKDGAYVINLDE